MLPEDGCRICAGGLELVRRGVRATLRPESLAPAEHAPGGHGDLYRCRECGTLQQPSLPPAPVLHDLYEQMRDRRYLDEEPGRRAAARRLLDRLVPHVPGGRLLDVGCGHGLLLDEARRRGYDTVGIELSADGVRHARDRLELDVRQASIEAAELEPGSFDAIVMTDVFEHLLDPVTTLRHCATLLAPGGALLVTTPDPSAPAARLAGGRWWSLIPAHHCLVPRATMRELLSAEGLVLAEDELYVRVFSLGYWIAGFEERLGPARGLSGRLGDRLPRERLLALALGDDRTYLARRLEVLQPASRLVRDRGRPLKVHAVIPAHNAQRTLAQVTRALPVDAIDRALLVDDASSDDTTATALELGLEVLRHPTNRGYGANQKTCYVRAALDGADIVVMVHGDNQYDPALVADMTAQIEAGAADVVLGSRLLEDEAVAGGMPRWKWVGNRALTAVENFGFRRGFSEYHTGYRAFSVDFLRRIPFLRNADGFVFDQEIFAQIVASQARVVELAIPTRYFLEASSVSFRESVRYGCQTLVILLRYRVDERRRRWRLLRRPAVTLAVRAPSPPVPDPVLRAGS